MKRIILSAILAMGLGLSASAEVNLNACAACHGKHFEKHAFGKSKIVKDLNASTISKELIEYKEGKLNQYGMGALMKGQVSKYSVKELNATGKRIKEINSSK